MGTRIKLKKLIEQTESELHTLISEAAQEKDYDLVAEIISVAKTLETHCQPNEKPYAPLKTSRTIVESVTAKKSVSRKKATKTNGDYPNFSVRGQDLIKTGWSKKAQKEYSQKVSRDVVNALAKRVMNYSEEEIFAIEDVLPDLLDKNGDALPSYQVYIALGFMKKHALVQQHGRQGYSISSKKDFAGQVEKQWNLLKKVK